MLKLELELPVLSEELSKLLIDSEDKNEIYDTNELEGRCLSGMSYQFKKKKNSEGMRANQWSFKKKNEEKVDLLFPECARKLQCLLC